MSKRFGSMSAHAMCYMPVFIPRELMLAALAEGSPLHPLAQPQGTSTPRTPAPAAPTAPANHSSAPSTAASEADGVAYWLTNVLTSDSDDSEYSPNGEGFTIADLRRFTRYGVAPCTSSEVCGVCHEPINRGQIYRELRCHHVFHCECVDRALESTPSCPICRATVCPPNNVVGFDALPQCFAAEAGSESGSEAGSEAGSVTASGITEGGGDATSCASPALSE